ncbi:MAG: glycoside hydrolase [candidate division WOR-3 bacterium]|nr:glycoside hydrolase [candidate division WOR-3 bacterium]MDH5683674.1 glycoside hydrolase [candidate division WOR-3 bacterium]
MRKYLLVLNFLMVLAFAQDSLPWQGAIVFEDWVRVDDAPGLTNHPANHPQTIMDDNWVLYSVWEDDRDNDAFYEIYFAISTDTGQSWGTRNINLSLNPEINDIYPWLAVDENNLYVVWQQSLQNDTWEVFITKSTDMGNTWTNPVEVPGITVVNNLSSGINVGPQPKLTVDSKSNPDTTFLYLLWADNGTGKIQIKLARSTDFGESFVDLGIIDNNLENVNRNPYIVVDDSGWVHCAWARGTGGTNQDPHPWIGYNRSQNRGNTFLANDIIVNDDFSEVYRGNPSMTYNPGNGDVLISWEDSRRASGNANPDIWFSKIHRDSLSFIPNKRVNWWGADTSIKYDNFKSVIRMDPKGIMVAAWHDDPERNGSYGIHLAAYSDTNRRFSNSQSLIQTYTGTSGANFGNAFYAPSLFVKALIDTAENDTITHFFLVWQDFREDSLGGNIYSVHGKVVKILGDLDVDNDSLDVKNDTLLVRAGTPGQEYIPYARGAFILANTSESYNPDPEDGPSQSRIDSLRYYGVLTSPRGRIDSIIIYNLPGSLSKGQTVVCTLALYIPAGTPDGDYTGVITIEGKDSLGVLIQETFNALVRILGDLDVDNDSLDVVNDTINLWTQPAGPVYTPYAKAEFILVNTSDAYNPDPEDGPSRSRIDFIKFYGVLNNPHGEIDSIFILNLPSSLNVGQSVECTLALVIPVGTWQGNYTGKITIEGYDTLGFLIQENFNLTVEGPKPRASLDSLRVAPIPFKPYRNPEHKKIHFQGLTRNAKIMVYDASGYCVWSATEDGDGHVDWDANVASGIYIYLVTSQEGENKKGKLSIIR